MPPMSLERGESVPSGAAKPDVFAGLGNLTIATSLVSDCLKDWLQPLC